MRKKRPNEKQDASPPVPPNINVVVVAKSECGCAVQNKRPSLQKHCRRFTANIDLGGVGGGARKSIHIRHGRLFRTHRYTETCASGPWMCKACTNVCARNMCMWSMGVHACVHACVCENRTRVSVYAHALMCSYVCACVFHCACVEHMFPQRCEFESDTAGNGFASPPRRGWETVGLFKT